MLALNEAGTDVDPTIRVIQTDATTFDNTFQANFYFAGVDLGHVLESSESLSSELPPDLFQMVPFARAGHPEDWTPKEGELGGWKPPVLWPFPSPYSR